MSVAGTLSVTHGLDADDVAWHTSTLFCLATTLAASVSESAATVTATSNRFMCPPVISQSPCSWHRPHRHAPFLT